VSIRKVASGEVLGTEDESITKTAAADWQPEDEEGLADENTEADGPA
jgi:hypothetical protein